MPLRFQRMCVLLAKAMLLLAMAPAAHAAVTLVSIAMPKPAMQMLPGSSVQLGVIGTFSNGTSHYLAASGEAFHSSNPALLTISPAGVATLSASAAAGATATLSAVDTASGLVTPPAASLTVTTARAIRSVSLLPAHVSVAPGGTWQLTATAALNDGTQAQLPLSSLAFTSSNPALATVSAQGVVSVPAHVSTTARATITAKYLPSGAATTAATGTSVSVAQPGSPPNAQSASAAATTATTNPLCTAIEPFYWEIGDAAAAIARGSVGVDSTGNPVSATTQYPVASASKWLYAAYVAQWRGGATHLTPQDIDFLHFTSGYTNMGNAASACVGAGTDAQCLQFAGPSGPSYATQNASTVGLFDYDGGHMENHAALAGTPLANQAYASLGALVGAALGPTMTIGYSQPYLAGGAYLDSNNYALFLRGILSGSLAMNALLGSSPVCTSVASCPTSVAYSPMPEAWHYSLGHWVEDDPKANGDGSFSSPGAYGYYPWIDATKTYYGLVSRSVPNGTGLEEGYQSAQCGRLIRAAFLTGVVQTGSLPVGVPVAAATARLKSGGG